MAFFDIAKIKRKTAKRRNNEADTDDVVLTAEQQQILAAVNAGRWGCQDSSVRALVTAITGIDCTESNEVGPYKKGTMVVRAGETLLIRNIDHDGDAEVYTANGGTTVADGRCNLHPLELADGVRYATDAEIDAFFGAA